MFYTHHEFEKVKQAIEYLQGHYREQPGLLRLAEMANTSPFHFQRIFSEWAGISPKKFLQYITLQNLKEKIHHFPNMQGLADEAGLSGASRAHDLFVNLEAVTPGAFKSRGKDLVLFYGLHPSPFGLCFAAVSDRGIHRLAFAEEETASHLLDDLREKWPNASLKEDRERTEKVIHQVFSQGKSRAGRLTLLVQGSSFRIKVWEALLHIPPGAVTTYQQIANAIGKPGAARAVGSAVGANPLAYLIPCHRVIRKEGMTGHYHWGGTRKKAMIGWELAQKENKKTTL